MWLPSNLLLGKFCQHHAKRRSLGRMEKVPAGIINSRRAFPELPLLLFLERQGRQWQFLPPCLEIMQPKFEVENRIIREAELWTFKVALIQHWIRHYMKYFILFKVFLSSFLILIPLSTNHVFAFVPENIKLYQWLVYCLIQCSFLIWFWFLMIYTTTTQ